MSLAFRLIIAISVAVVGIITSGVVGELYGTWPRMWAMTAFAAAVGIFWVLSKK